MVYARYLHWYGRSVNRYVFRRYQESTELQNGPPSLVNLISRSPPARSDRLRRGRRVLEGESRWARTRSAPLKSVPASAALAPDAGRRPAHLNGRGAPLPLAGRCGPVLDQYPVGHFRPAATTRPSRPRRRHAPLVVDDNELTPDDRDCGPRSEDRVPENPEDVTAPRLPRRTR